MEHDKTYQNWEIHTIYMGTINMQKMTSIIIGIEINACKDKIEDIQN